ncbi:MAG: CHAT domain-containing protein [Fulvivirga sp.]
MATKSIQLGDLHNNQRNHAKAIEHYEDYLTTSKQLGVYRNTETEASVHRKLAQSKSALSKYEAAEMHLQKARELDSLVNKNELALLEDLRLTGILKAYRGDYQQALGILSAVLSRSAYLISSNKSVNKESLLKTHLAMARLRMALGDFYEAQGLLSKVQSLGKSVSNYTEYADEVHLVKGIISREQGDLDSAEIQINKSIELAQSASRLPSRQFEALAQVELLKGNYEEALRHQLDAYKYAEKIGINSQIVNALLRLGDIYKAVGDNRSAEASYSRALDLQPDVTSTRISNGSSEVARLKSSLDMYEFQGAKTGVGLAAIKLVEYKLNHDDWNDLELLILTARANFVETGSDEGLSRTLLASARLSAYNNDNQRALADLDSASKLSQQPNLQWKIFHQKGLVHTQLNSFNNARSAYERSIAIIEELRDNLNLEDLKSAFFSDKVDVYEDYIALLLEQYKLSSEHRLLLDAFVLNEKARARSFLDMLGNKKVGYSSGDKSVVEDERRLRIKIKQLNQQIFKATERRQIQELSHELELAQREYQQILLNIKLNHPSYDNLISVEPPDLASIQNRLDDNSVIVEYWFGKKEITIWMVDRRNIKAVQVAVSELEISREMSAFRNAVSLQMSEFINKSLNKLYKYLITPIESDIDVYENLIIIPNGVSHFLPFQALRNSKSQYLIEKFIISTAPSASVWYHCKRLSQSEFQSKFLGLALGNSAIGQFPGLPGTLTEVNQLASIYKSFDTQNEQGFTEGFLKEAVSDYDYVHIATHGVLNTRQPGYSYLLMHPSEHDDGRLTVNEIFNIKLNARLVTLSACETGLGELSRGDDLIGLSRAFIYSGTPAVVVSLWKVDDATTSVLMKRFNGYLSSGKGAAESLAFAQRDMINGAALEGNKAENISSDELLSNVRSSGYDDNVRNPYFWGPFTLIGH